MHNESRLEHFKEWLDALYKLLNNPEDIAQLEDYKDAFDEITDNFDFITKQELFYVNKIREILIRQYELKINQKRKLDESNPSHITQEFLYELINRKQIEQRTPEWYEQMTKVISASEIGNLFSSPYIRSKLVLSKTIPYVPKNNPLAVRSKAMSAFDWGIRFEPVVKQIYTHKYGVIIKELGRLHHKEYSNCTASPDGLIYHCPENKKMGDLIEIKCPVTREIDGNIPKDYYSQMQMQLHVTGCNRCHYVEAQFSSPYGYSEIKEGPGLYCGNVALIKNKETITSENTWIGNLNNSSNIANISNITIRLTEDMYYEYGPLNDWSWIPELKENEELIELIPWKLMQWSEQLVLKSEMWWNNVKPLIDEFWADVEKAKKGEFIAPEPSKNRNKQVCQNNNNEFQITIPQLIVNKLEA